MSVRRWFRPRVESLEVREVPALNPTGQEQEMLELLNRMRMHPAQELALLVDQLSPIHSPDSEVNSALHYFNVNGVLLQQQWNSLTAVPPVAWNELLVGTAAAHNHQMILQDDQQHELPGEPSLSARIANAGYNYSYLGESIYAYSESVFYGHAGFAIDWGFGAGGIQNPPGHRNNMMASHFREVGISVTTENNPATDVGPLVITQDFGRRFGMGNPFLLGVAFDDKNGNGFYEAGEGLGGVNVQITGAGIFTTTTMTAGGWQVQVPPGSYTVTFFGGGLSAPIMKDVTVGSDNVKLDFKKGDSSTSHNHAPVLNTSGNPALSTIAEDSAGATGTTIAALLGSAISDVDADAVEGAAITGVTGTVGGTWEYSTDDGASWLGLNDAAASAARLLRDTDLVRFRPNANFSGQATLTVRAWDQTSGNVGETVNLGAGSVGGSAAFSTALETVTITVAPVNDAPVLDAGTTQVLTVTPQDSIAPPPTKVSALLAGVSDADGAAALGGIAVVGVSGADNGTWQYSTNSTTWLDLGAVSDAAARLLADTARLRFRPNPGYLGVVDLVFRAWDRTSGADGSVVNIAATGGTTAYSDATDSASLSVFPVNHAPVLDTASTPRFTPILTGNPNPSGNTVADLLGSAVTDADAGAIQGIAVTALTNTAKGRWQYSLNAGAAWLAFGAVSTGAARLLRAEDRIRFVPNAGFGGTATLTFRAWDQTSESAGGTAKLASVISYGGITAFSALTDVATVLVNSSPTLNSSGTPTLPNTSEDSVKPPSTAISKFLTSIVTEVDKGALKGIAVTAATGDGVWQFSANNATWIDLGAVSDNAARLLPDNYRVRFKPNLNFNGPATMTFQAWDRTIGVAAGFGDATVSGGGGVSAFSVDSETISLQVTPVNDAPVLNAAGGVALAAVSVNAVNPSGDRVGDVFGGLISDVDAGASQGIAVTAATRTSTGRWQYSLDVGTTWIDFGAVSAAKARLLRAGDRIRYVPAAGFAGSATLSIRAWDLTSGVAGGTANLAATTSVGGTKAFSAEQVMATVAVA